MTQPWTLALSNRGNTCFFNAALQILLSPYFTQSPWVATELLRRLQNGRRPQYSILQEVLYLVLEKQRGGVFSDGREFFRKFNALPSDYADGRAGDPSEVIMRLFAREDELQPAGADTFTLGSLFEILVARTTRCTRCNYTSTVQETQRNLHVSVTDARNVAQFFAVLQQPEEIIGYDCPACKAADANCALPNGTRHMQFLRLPHLLLLEIKRQTDPHLPVSSAPFTAAATIGWADKTGHYVRSAIIDFLPGHAHYVVHQYLPIGIGGADVCKMFDDSTRRDPPPLQAPVAVLYEWRPNS